MTDDRSGDTSDDMSGDSRWITYDELARLRGIARASAERLVQRKGWRRQRGNDRTVRVLVPMNSSSGDMSDDVSGDMSPDTRLLAGALAALEGAVAALTARAEAADQRAEQAEARADADRGRADNERDKAAAAEGRAVKAEHDRDQLLASHNRALLEVEGLRQADRARRAGGRLARAVRGWRGE